MSNKGGRPTRYTNKMADEICNRLAGGESLNSICRDPHIAARSNVLTWVLSDKPVYAGFQDRYEKARAVQAECFIDDIMDIADNATNDYMERNDPENPGYNTNGEAINRSRLRVDTRKWYASKVMTRFKDKPEKDQSIVVQNIMPVPTADSVESWEEQAKKQQEKTLGS